ncbi:hypothetical protein [Desulfurivibrio dismutans]|uniref:hypothetical protein n=1 Tax=Desulfurivibrio dismutans TaxID=1398908 RepID=UPI0023DA7D38|nr:hypothetical protein [Desulfurivibrio alkaliphilus]MDF1614302.1 hypothetical protein [Desulfurivibrio alkaliphilus]
MIANKKEFSLGLVLFIGFWGVFVVLMSPVFAGTNLLDYMDNLYNSISKNSAYYIPGAQERAGAYQGREITFAVAAKDQNQALRTAKNFEMLGARVEQEGTTLQVTGDMGRLLVGILEDADRMYHNDGAAIVAKYGIHERLVVYDWWNALKTGQDDLNRQHKFAEAKVFYDAMTRGVEPAYNYYQIEAEPIRNKAGTVVLSLAGYVFYTLWFGFAILFMFEGWGIKLEH